LAFHTFDLQELKKGYFPHFFTTQQNRNYIGAYPDAEQYGYNTVSDKDRSAFLSWHDNKIANNEIFDFDKEIHSLPRVPCASRKIPLSTSHGFTRIL
jgi:hypothetical protein